MKISKLALIALLGGALMAFGCSSDGNGAGGSGGDGGTGGDGGAGGGPPTCFDDGRICENAFIDPIVPCCTPTAPPVQEDACTGTESLDNPASCEATGTEVLHQLTVLEIFGDCNGGYDLDTCTGVSCRNGGLAPGEGMDAVDNGLAGLGPALAGVGGNLGNVNQALADAICGTTDADEDAMTGENGCEAMISVLDLKFNVDANVEASCATVDLISGETELGTIFLNLSAPNSEGSVCASGTIGTVPLEVAGEAGEFQNAVIRMTVSGNGFTDGVLGATVGAATAEAIADALLEGASAVVSQVFDINEELVNDNTVPCNALSATFSIAGAAVPAPQ